MRTRLIAAGLCFGIYSLGAEIDGPRPGYVVTKAGLRSVMGIVGAARLSDPLATDLASTVVLPGSDIAVGVDANGELSRVDIKDGSKRGWGITGINTLTASPSGESVLAITGEHAYLFSRSGDRLGERTLPGIPLLSAMADRGSAVAVTIAEGDGEALYLVNDQGARRVLHAAHFSAIAFLPGSSDLVVSDGDGAIYRIGIDLQLAELTRLPGTKALAGTPDGTRLLIVTEQAVATLRFATQETTSISCACTGAIARSLGAGMLVITNSEAGPLWVVDVSSEELRLAFIPEPVNE
ncbi:MAG TPA: hypothetical protein VEX68_13265 [Bryobacteraceae bacterium]|nr:hypothetical protein [Bryobacteraceae bacterium]